MNVELVHRFNLQNARQTPTVGLGFCLINANLLIYELPYSKLILVPISLTLFK